MEGHLCNRCFIISAKVVTWVKSPSRIQRSVGDFQDLFRASKTSPMEGRCKTLCSQLHLNFLSKQPLPKQVIWPVSGSFSQISPWKMGSCHKRQRRKRQSVTAKREKSQTPKFVTANLYCEIIGLPIIWRLRLFSIGAYGVGACSFWLYRVHSKNIK